MSDPKRKFVPFDEIAGGDSAAQPSHVPFDDILASEPAPHGHVTEMPVQHIEGDPMAGDAIGQLLAVRDRDMAANGGLNPTERMAQAATGGKLPSAGIGRAALQGAGISALESRRDHPGESWVDTLLKSGEAAVGSAALHGAFRGSGMTAGAASNKFGNAANENRVRAAGLGTKEIETMNRDKPDALAELAANIEREGLHKGSGVTGFLPQGPRTYHDNAQALLERGRQGMNAGESAIAKLPEQPTVDVGNTIEAQRYEANRLAGLADQSGNRPQARFRNELANGLESDAAAAGPNGELPWTRALEQRRNLDANSKFGAGAPQTGPAAAKNAIRKEVAGDLRGGIDRSLDSANVPPEVAQQWRGARDQFHLGSQVAEPAFKAMTSPNAGTNGLANEAGARFGLAGRLGASAFGALNGNAALAGAQRGAQTMSGGTAAVANAAAGGPAAMLGAGATQSLDPNAAAGHALQSWMGDKGVRMEQAPSAQGAGQSRGNLLPQAAEKLLQTEPGALGQWQPEFAKAQADGTLSALISKLNNDPQFRTGPGAKLLQMTAEQP